MVFGIVMTFLGLGAFCALLYYSSVFALPAFVGLSAAFWAMNSGAGLGSILVGLATGVLVFILGPIAFSGSRSPIVRWSVGLLFAGPAAIAGYSMVLALSAFGIPSVIWQHVFGLIGAAITAGTAFVRLGNSSAELPKASTTS